MAGPFYRNGNYLAEILDIAFTDDGSKQQIVFKLRIMSEWNAGANDWVACDQQYERTVWMSIPEQEEHLPFVTMKLRQAGWHGTSFETLRDDMLGKNVIVKNEIRMAKGGKYAGKEVEGWDLPLPPKESQPLEHHPELAKRLDGLMGSLLNSSSNTESGKLSEIPADEIPF